MKITEIPIGQIKPAAYNPREPLRPGDTHYEALKKNIQEFGLVEPLVWNKRTGNLVGGHQRLGVLQDLGYKTVPCMVVDLDKRPEMALNVGLNKISGEWDIPKLKEVLLDIDRGDLDLQLTGFTEEELADLIDGLDKGGLTDPDSVPATPKKAITKPGNMWFLGQHRLLCGDSTVITDVARALGNAKASMIFTDPPWNVAIGMSSNPKHRQREGLKNDNLGENFMEFLHGWTAACLPSLEGDIYCVMGSREWPNIDQALRDAGMHWSAVVIWVKDHFVLGRRNYHPKFEPIWYGWPDRCNSSYGGGRNQDDVWEFPKPAVSEDHPTMKPVDLVVKAIENSSKRGDIVFDPFLGSGTTLLAAEKVGRKCVGLELEPRYCDVIVKRWELFTGKKAVLANKREMVAA